MHKVYERLAEVPRGRITTYGELARAAKTSPRAVGRLMNKNPFAPRVPCHRVVMSNGKLGGFASGEEQKIGLLRREGIVVKNGLVVDFEKKLYGF